MIEYNSIGYICEIWSNSTYPATYMNLTVDIELLSSQTIVALTAVLATIRILLDLEKKSCWGQMLEWVHI